jgi:hypothetical protein
MAAVASAQITFPVRDVLSVNHFDEAHNYRGEAEFRVVNPGTFEAGTGLYPRPGDLCAFVYVFDRNQQLLECCGCVITPNGLREFDINDDLTSNSLTGGIIEEGVIKVVSHPKNGPAPKVRGFFDDLDCNPASITNPQPTLRAWAVHLNSDAEEYNEVAATETESLEAPLSLSEVRRLQGRCRFIITNASGAGLCYCGEGGIDP